MSVSAVDYAEITLPEDVLKHHIVPYLVNKEERKCVRAVNKALTKIVKLPRCRVSFQKLQNPAQLIKVVEIFTDVCARRIKTPGAIVSLAKAITHPMSQVTILNLENCVLRKDLPDLMEVLKSATSLKKLNLTKTKISDQTTHYIADFLIFNTHLLDLDLSDNAFRSRGLSEIVDALKINSTLQSLALSGIDVWDHPSGPHCIEDLLVQNRGLTELNLGRTGEHEPSNRMIPKVAAGLGRNQVLKKLVLSFQRFDQTNANLLRDALICNTTLEALNVCYASGLQTFVQTILSCLERNSSLTELFFSSNSITDESTNTCFFSLLQHPTCNIRRMVPSYDRAFISVKNSSDLREALMRNNSLRELNIRPPKGTVVNFASGLSGNRCLVVMDIECIMSQDCYDALAEALRKNETLTRLFLRLKYGDVGPDINLSNLLRSLAHRSCCTDQLRITATTFHLSSVDAVIELLDSRKIMNLTLSPNNDGATFQDALTEALKTHPEIGRTMLSVVAPVIGSYRESQVFEAWEATSAKIQT